MREDRYILTKEECLAKGGHIWEPQLTIHGVNSIYGIATKDDPEFRFCKYCGQRQKGYYLPEIWEE